MRYFSTRGAELGKSFKDAVMTGLASDGGLLLPEFFPDMRGKLNSFKTKSYTEIAFEVIKEFADDVPQEDLKRIIELSYSTFDTREVTPLVNLSSVRIVELFHGPTYAFKDVALQFLGNMFEYILRTDGGRLNIIGATSGDTGSAAIYGVRGKANINIAILYPDGRISPIQEKQMTCVGEANVHTFAVDGTFDDCQNIVKALFADAGFKKEYFLGAVNSINWARIMAQIVYYFYAYSRMNTAGKVSFVVPTGNFGNIFAGYCAKEMGLPVEKLVLATNSNDILHRFVSTGDYSLKDVAPTHSPAMDIQLASNFERYLYFLYGKDSLKVQDAMAQIKKEGRINFTAEEISTAQSVFSSYGVSDEEIEKTIRHIYESDKYVADPHTACGIATALHLGYTAENTVVLSTAHPSKFSEVVGSVLGFIPPEPDGIRALQGKTPVITKTHADIEEIKDKLKSIFK